MDPPRHRFGGTAADWVFTYGTGGVVQRLGNAITQCWNALSGGTQHTDLQTLAGAPITTVTADAYGELPEFYGPPGVIRLAVDANGGAGPRRWILATDLGESVVGLPPGDAATNTANIQAMVNLGLVPALADGVVYDTNAPLIIPPVMGANSPGATMAYYGGSQSMTLGGAIIHPTASFAGTNVGGQAVNGAVVFVSKNLGGYPDGSSNQFLRGVSLDGRDAPAGVNGVEAWGPVWGVTLVGVGIYGFNHDCATSASTPDGTGKAPGLWSIDHCHFADADYDGLNTTNGLADSYISFTEFTACGRDGAVLTGGNTRLVGCKADWNARRGYNVYTGAGGGMGIWLDGCSSDHNGEDSVYYWGSGRATLSLTNFTSHGDGYMAGAGGSGHAGIRNTATNGIIHGTNVKVLTVAGSSTACPQYGVRNDGASADVQISGGTIVGGTTTIYHGTGASRIKLHQVLQGTGDYDGGTATFKPAGQEQGLKWMTGGGVVSRTDVDAAVGEGWTGMFFDPGDDWNLAGLDLHDLTSVFRFKSAQYGAIGWLGDVKLPAHYTSTGSGANGIVCYSSNPATYKVSGIVFEDMTLVGSNTTACLNWGGGQRRCGLVNTLVKNTNATAGAYAMITGSSLSDNNSESMIFDFSGGGGLAGAYAALGIGVGDQTARSNDCVWHSLITSSTGVYSVRKDGGGNHLFLGYYDRTTAAGPSGAVVYNHGGGRMVFYGGEDQNNSTGYAILADNNSLTICYDRMISAGGSTATIGVSGGARVVLRGLSVINGSQTLSVTGTGILDLAAPEMSCGSGTVTGDGILVLAENYYPHDGPVTSSFTGTIKWPSCPGWTGLTPGNGYTNSGSGPSLRFRRTGDRIEVAGDLSVPASPNVVIATLPSGNNVPNAQQLKVTIITSTGAAQVTTPRVYAQGSPAALTAASIPANTTRFAVSGTVFTSA